MSCLGQTGVQRGHSSAHCPSHTSLSVTALFPLFLDLSLLLRIPLSCLRSAYSPPATVCPECIHAAPHRCYSRSHSALRVGPLPDPLATVGPDCAAVERRSRRQARLSARWSASSCAFLSSRFLWKHTSTVCLQGVLHPASVQRGCSRGSPFRPLAVVWPRPLPDPRSPPEARPLHDPRSPPDRRPPSDPVVRSGPLPPELPWRKDLSTAAISRRRTVLE